MTDKSMRKYPYNKYLCFWKSGSLAWIQRCSTTPEKEKTGNASAFLEREPDRGLITKSKPSRSELVSSSRNDFAKHEFRCLHVRRRERQRFSGLQKKGVPRVSGSLHSSLGQSKSAFSSGRFLYLESRSKRF